MNKSALYISILIISLCFIITGAIAQEEADLVDIQALDPTIIVELKYATDDNFAGQRVYPADSKAYLRLEVAEKLVRVQEKLQEIGLGLKVFDAYRPHAVQYKFWELVPDPRYVADPALGSNHNRGAAVDVTLVDSEGNELLMPTGFDDFTEKAHRDYYDLPEEAIKNRELLEEYMTAEGFVPLPTEWWHFDDEYVCDYPVLDIPLDEVKSVVPATN